MADVFVSYAQEDRAFVERLVAVIERAGLDVWYDTRLRPGQSFDEVIATELDRAGAVLVVWSAASVKSFWVRDEAQVGATRGVLVPVSADGTPPPLGFRQFQSLDLSGWRGGETAALRVVTEELRDRADRTRVLPTQPEAEAAPSPESVPPPPATPAPRRQVGRTRRIMALALGALVVGGAVASLVWLDRTNNRAEQVAVSPESAVTGADGDPVATGTAPGADRLAAWSCSLLRVRPGYEAGEPVIDGVFGAAHDPAPLGPELAPAFGREPTLRATSLPDVFCPVLDALRAKAYPLFVSRWMEPRAEYTTAHDGTDTARAIQLSFPVETLNPERVVYVLSIEAETVETLLILHDGKFEGQTQGDIPAPVALPEQGSFSRTIFRSRPSAPELALFLELDRRVPQLEDALDLLTPSDSAALASLLTGPDAPAISAARLVVLERGWVYPPGFAAEPAPERKIEALYHWLQANRPAWFKAPPLPSPYTFAAAAFTPVAVEALYIDAELGDGPFSAADILFSDLVPPSEGATDQPFEGQLAVDEVALATNDGKTATVRAIVSRADPGQPVRRRTIDLTLSRIDGIWLISDARWPDRGASDQIPRGATMRNLIEAHLAREQENEENQ